jgi:hypothetical protein
MARNATPGRKQINVEMPEELLARLDARAADCRRSRSEELFLAVEGHLSRPPVATVEDATGKAKSAPAPKAKGGRK